MKQLVFVLFLIWSLKGTAQPKEQSLNISVGYNLLNLDKNKDGIRGSLGYQYRWLQLSFDTHFNVVNYYDEQDENRKRIMKDKFFRIGGSLDFRVLNIDKHSLFLGVQYGKFYMTEHYYYYEVFASNEINEVVCNGDGCPALFTSNSNNYDFGIRYNSHYGMHLNYKYNIWDEIYLGLIVDVNRMSITRFDGINAKYNDDTVWGFSPSVNLT